MSEGPMSQKGSKADLKGPGDTMAVHFQVFTWAWHTHTNCLESKLRQLNDMNSGDSGADTDDKHKQDHSFFTINTPKSHSVGRLHDPNPQATDG